MTLGGRTAWRGFAGMQERSWDSIQLQFAASKGILPSMRISTLCALYTSLAACSWLGLSLAESPADPPALTTYQGRTIAQTMHWKGAPWLQRREREEEEHGGVMRQQLEIKPGQTVCDLGSGDGYHTLWMASVVGETGKVYAVDIQKEMLDMLEKRAAGRGYKNVIPVLGTPWDPKLPPQSQDLILLVDVYHEFSHPEHMLRSMRAALKPTGRMVLVEFRSEDDKVPIKPEHKMSKEQMLKEILPMGFKLAKEFNELPWQHFMSFAKDETIAPVK